MIRKPISLAIAPIANSITERGLVITPKENTVLAELVKWSYDITNTDGIVSTEAENVDMLVTETANVVSDGMGGHGAAIDAEVSTTSEILARQLRYVKEVAKPTIDAIYAAVTDRVSNADEESVEIIEYSMPDLYNSEAIGALLSVYKHHNYRAIRSAKIKGFPERDEKELLDLIGTGSPGFDSLVIDIITAHPVGWVEQVYNDHFVKDSWDKVAYDTTLNSEVNLYAPGINNLDEYLIIFRLAEALSDAPHDSYKGPLSEYRARVSAKLRAAAVAMILTIAEYNKQVSNETLVLKYDHNCITVNAIIYHKYLDNGGLPEAILGAAQSESPRPYKLNEFKERTVKFVASHNRFLQQRAIRNDANVVTSLRYAIKYAMHDLIDGPLASQLPNLVNYLNSEQPEVSDSGTVSDINDRTWYSAVNKLVEEVPARSLTESPYLVIRKLLNKLAWPGTNIDSILTAIDSELEKHPDLDPREGAYRATIRILVRHYLKQVDIERTAV